MEGPVEYRFPIVRPFTFTTTLLLTDVITTLLLWILHNQQLTDNIEHFHIETSVFDLVCISLMRCLLIATIKASLESMTISSAQQGRNNKLRRTLMSVLGVVIILGTFVYVTIKDVKVYKRITEDEKVMKSQLHRALCIVAFVFPLIHLVVFILFLRHLRRLHVRHYFSLNEDTAGVPNGSATGATAEEKEEQKKKKVNVRRLMTLAAPEKWILVAGTVGLLGSTGAQIIAPKYFGGVIQAAADGSMSDLNNHIIILFVIYTVQSVASFVRAWLYTLAGQSIVARLRRDLFDKIIRQEIAFFDTSRTGELMNRY